MSIGNIDPYYLRTEVSNSDLSKLKMYFSNAEYVRDATEAYRFGNLVDAMILEPTRCDHYNLRVDNQQFYRHEWDHADKMRQSFFADAECSSLMKICDAQAIMTDEAELENDEGIKFTTKRRCKWDMWFKRLHSGADIKSTAAKTEKEFYNACIHFDYPRSRAWYMDIAGSDTDIMFGISKKNFKIFKIRINRGDELYNLGKVQYLDLAWKHWLLFDGITT